MAIELALMGFPLLEWYYFINGINITHWDVKSRLHVPIQERTGRRILIALSRPDYELTKKDEDSIKVVFDSGQFI